MFQLRHKLIAPVLFLLGGGFAYGQTAGSVTGTVRDPQQAVIPGARVTIMARDNTATLTVATGKEGRYHAGQIAPGTYLVEAAAEGFATSGVQAVQIEKGAPVTLDFLLQVAGIDTAVVVTAATTPQATDELSKAVSVVDGQTINLRSESSIADALGDVPGLRVQTLGGPGQLTSIKTRGLRDEDTAVLIDGFRLRDTTAPQGDATSLLADLAVTDVDRVEVLRGAGSSLYGTNAIGGVVNVITAEGGGPTHGSLLAEGGSLGMFRGRGVVSGGLKGDQWQYTLGLSQLDVTNGVGGEEPARNTSAQGRLDYAPSSKFRIFARILATDAFTKLRSDPQAVGNLPASGIINAVPLSSSALEQYENGTAISQLDPGAATYIPAFSNPDATLADRFLTGAISLSAHPLESLGITASYSDLTTRRRYGDGPAGAGYQPSGNSLSYYDGGTHTANARVDYRLGAHNAIDAGYEFELESFGNSFLQPDPADNSNAEVRQRSDAVYAQDQVSLLGGRLQLAASGRVQFFALDQPVFAPASSAPYSNLAVAAPPAAQTGDGSIAYFFHSTGTKVRSHVGRGYRAPSLYERFGTSYYGGFGYTVYGNPRLAPEHSLTADGGIDQMLWNGRARLSATYFYTDLQQVIFFAPALTGDPLGRYMGYQNSNGGLARGVETSAALAPTRSLTLNAAYTYNNARERTPIVEDILRTFEIPDHQFSLAAVERVSARLTLLFDLRASSNYLAPIYDPVNYVDRAYLFPGLRRAQIEASYRLPLDDRHAIRFYAKGDNIFNQTYFENGFLTPGATALGGMQYEF